MSNKSETIMDRSRVVKSRGKKYIKVLYTTIVKDENQNCFISINGKAVAQSIADIATIRYDGIKKEIVGNLSRTHQFGRCKSIRLAKRKIKELERLLWQ